MEKGSAADKAGIHKDDIITSLNGEKVNSVDEVRQQLGEFRDGKTLSLKALRNSSEMTFKVKFPKPLKSANL